jgi:hypothetical protein
MCGGQDNNDHWLAPSHDPVVMGLSRRGDAPDKPGSSHEGNADAGYPHPANERFPFHFAAQVVPMVLLTLIA